MSREIIRTSMQGNGMNYATEYNTGNVLEKDGHYRRIQAQRERDRKLARERHQEWLEEQGFE